MSLNFVSKGKIDNDLTLDQVMAWLSQQAITGIKFD